MKKKVAIAFLALAAASLAAQTRSDQRVAGESKASNQTETGEWSAPANAIKARLVICKAMDTNALASFAFDTAVIYLESQNTSRSVNARQVFYGAASSWKGMKPRLRQFRRVAADAARGASACEDDCGESMGKFEVRSPKGK